MKHNAAMFVLFLLFGAIVSCSVLIGSTVSEALAIFLAYCCGGLMCLTMMLPVKKPSAPVDTSADDLAEVLSHDILCRDCEGVYTTQNDYCKACLDPKHPIHLVSKDT